MRKTVLSCLLFLLWIVPAICQPRSLTVEDIPRVMDRFFSLHIENRELSTTLVKRAFKLYVEQFDAEKVYLLESEILPFLNLSDRKAGEILSRLKNRDYSDFFTLNQLFQKAILRAQGIRSFVTAQLIHDESLADLSVLSGQTQFTTSEEGLIERQKGRMVRFF